MAERPWLAHYDPGVPHSLAPYPERTLLDQLSEAVNQNPNHAFLLFKGRQFSWRQIARLSAQFAAALVEEGVQKGDRVALVLPNCPQMVIALFGVWRAGAIAVPLSPLYTEKELEHALTNVGATVAVVLTLCYTHVKAVQSRTTLRRIIATSIKDFLPPHLAFLFTLVKEKKEGHRITLAEGDRWFKSLLRHSPDATGITPRPDDPACLLFTGGTTGTAKAAVCTHQGLVMSGLQLHAWGRKTVLLDWDSVILLFLPLFHVYGTWILAAAMASHVSLALIPNPRDLNDVVATIRRTKPAFLPGIPTFFASLLEHPAVKAGKLDLTCLRACSCGAAPLMSETQRRFEAQSGARVNEGYALTESCCGATASPVLGTRKPGSVGIPLPDVEIRIVDAATGHTTLPTGQVGEILMRAPQMIRGYWGNPAESESMLRDGWLYTGDLGYMDQDGFLFIVDRKKDVIKASGFQVWPREVEEVIAAHPAVALVGVAGIPDARGEAVKAWVVLKQGAQATAEEIRTHCREHLSGYKVPREVEFRSSLPLTPVGKVLRRELRNETRAPAPEQQQGSAPTAVGF